MEHSLPLISTLVIAFSLALVFGFLAERLFKAPPLVGYLLAGIAAGKYTPGVFADAALAHQLSEIGVMLLMFGVGLHFSVRDLMNVKGIAVPGAVLQMFIATLLGGLVAHFVWDWHWGDALVLGMCLSCASTVVLLKALEVRGILQSMDGQIAVGWLVVEDVATVLILVLLPPLAGLLGSDAAPGITGKDIAIQIALTIGNVIAFIAVMMLVGRRLLPWLMAQVARTGSRELFTLFVLAAAVGIAYGASAIFNVSFALGAFFAGMVMRESKFAHRAATESLPLQDAFSVLFFVGVGMLFDWHIIIEAPLSVLTVLLIIMLGKGLAAFGLVYMLRYPLHTALTVSASLAQIGEFSFILVGQAQGLGLATDYTVNLIVGAAILSIALNPVVFSFIPAMGRELTSRWAWARAAALREAPFERVSNETPAEQLHNQIVITGKSRLLTPLATELHKAGTAVVAIVQDHDLATELDKLDVTVIVGNPADPQSMVAAHLKNAGMLMILDNSTTSLRIAEAARAVKGDTPITIVAPDPGIWTDVPGIDGVRYVCSYESAAEKISVDVNAAFAENAPVGTIINTKLAEAAAREEERAEGGSAKNAPVSEDDSDVRPASETVADAHAANETAPAEPVRSETSPAPESSPAEAAARGRPVAEASETSSSASESPAQPEETEQARQAGPADAERPGIFSFWRRK